MFWTAGIAQLRNTPRGKPSGQKGARACVPDRLGAPGRRPARPGCSSCRWAARTRRPRPGPRCLRQTRPAAPSDMASGNISIVVMEGRRNCHGSSKLHSSAQCCAEPLSGSPQSKKCLPCQNAHYEAGPPTMVGLCAMRAGIAGACGLPGLRRPIAAGGHGQQAAAEGQWGTGTGATVAVAASKHPAEDRPGSALKTAAPRLLPPTLGGLVGSPSSRLLKG